MNDEHKNPSSELSQETHERLCAYLFGELSGDDRTALENELEHSAALTAELERLTSTVALVRGALPAEQISEESIGRLVQARAQQPRRFQFLRGGGRALRIAAAFVVLIGAGFGLKLYLLPPLMPASEEMVAALDDSKARYGGRRLELDDAMETLSALGYGGGEAQIPAAVATIDVKNLRALGYLSDAAERVQEESAKAPAPSAQPNVAAPAAQAALVVPAESPGRMLERTMLGDTVAKKTARQPSVEAPELSLRKRGAERERPTHLRGLGYIADAGEEEPRPSLQELTQRLMLGCQVLPDETPRGMYFRCWGDHPFVPVTQEDHLSTFSVDVDTASYALARRTLMAGRFPVADQVRTEEFVNYFSPDQQAPPVGPDGIETFVIGMELAPSRFADRTRTDLLRITLRGRDVEDYERQPLALTFVVDVSGSMRNGHRLDHVKEALGLLVRKLDAGDSIALVAFNSEARLVSPMNSAASRGALEDALFGLEANQGTNVASGLMLGFRTAAENLVAGAVNRVILLSDGVGNIGETDQARILESVEEFRKQDIYLNTIGVGLENHSDHFLEQLADRGDGVYNYIGSLGEAKKVMVDDFTKTLQPIARDVKIQVDFDPSQVESYRQLGYENRALRDDQFRDDKVDAGEVNAGHQVTALFEIVRKPQSTTGSFVTVRVRYKLPFAIDRGQISAAAKRQAEAALEIEQTLRWDQVATSFHATSWGYRRDVLVAQFAELLRQSVHARGERAAELLSEVQMLTRERRGDPELGEFEGLLRRALPGLEKLEERYYARPEWQDVVDELRRMHYRIARGELLDLDEARSEKLLKQLEARLREMISATGAEDMRRLEGQIAEFLSAGGDVSPQRLQALDTREQLKALGYSR